VLLYVPLTKVFYSNMVYTFLNLLDLISLLCLWYVCRCPLTNNLWSVGILPSSVVKLLPFDHPYSLGIDMLVPLDSSILLFQIVTSENSVSSLNILVYMSMTFLSSEIPLYSIVKSLSFVFFYSLVLVCLYPWSLAYSHIFQVCLPSYPMTIQDISVNMPLTTLTF
jgi:hypothetical protein